MASKGASWRPTHRSISQAVANIAKTQVVESRPTSPVELRQSFYGVDFRRQQSQDRGLVTASGADLENTLLSMEPEGVHHQGHHVWLGHGLTTTNVHGSIGKAVAFFGTRQKVGPGDPTASHPEDEDQRSLAARFEIGPCTRHRGFFEDMADQVWKRRAQSSPLAPASLA